MGFIGYNHIQISLEDKSQTTVTCPWGTYSYIVSPFGLCNAHAIFQREILGIFSNLTHECFEIYMDDFTIYGLNFEITLTNLEKVLKYARKLIYLSAMKSDTCYKLKEFSWATTSLLKVLKWILLKLR